MLSTTPPPANENPPLLAAERLCKRFAAVYALRDVSLNIGHGEVVAVIGENGAGKSTLMKILSGVIPPDSGEILWRGQRVSFRRTADAIEIGISLIHQELNLVDNLSIAENLFLGREPNRFGWVLRKPLLDQAAAYLAKVGLDVDPARSLGRLSIAEKQLVEIAKAVSTGAKVLIMDEPTSSLSNRETERLFELVDALRAAGTSVVYISHRLGEVSRLADRVEVLRDGQHVGSIPKDKIDHDTMVRAMVGRDPQSLMPRSHTDRGPVRLSVRDLRVEATEADISLDVRGGEIVVLAGLIGAGRTELLETIFGIRSAEKGDIHIDDKPLAPGNIRRGIAAGLALVSEDRKATGLHLQSSVTHNMTIVSLPHSPAAPRIDPKWEAARTDEQIRSLAIKTATPRLAVASLSGGNQQKIAIAKWLIEPPKVMLLDEPTRGVDVGARHEIYLALRALADRGVAILIVSSDMEEVIGVADRVLVMHEHRITGELVGDAVTEPAIMNLAVGGGTALPA
jgi:ribose transport system ATP-binding protein